MIVIRRTVRLSHPTWPNTGNYSPKVDAFRCQCAASICALHNTRARGRFPCLSDIFKISPRYLRAVIHRREAPPAPLEGWPGGGLQTRKGSSLRRRRDRAGDPLEIRYPYICGLPVKQQIGAGIVWLADGRARARHRES